MDRLSKILARAGVASRRSSEKLIASKRVTVDGNIITRPQEKCDPLTQEICVDGKKIETEEKVYFLLNKPKGYLCSNAQKGKLVRDLFVNVSERIFTVGRLDKDTEGLILLTNDGEFANQVIHPRFNLEKEYLLKTNIDITHDHLIKLSKGCLIEGARIIPVKLRKVRKNTCKIVVKEGKKHEVRLLAKNAGLTVIHLQRIRIGSLVLGSIPVGHYRRLRKKEIEQLLGRTP